MNKVLTFSLMLLFGMSGHCQNWTWAKGYGNFYDDRGYSVGRDQNDNLYITGYNSLPASGPNPGFYYELLYKFDSKGEHVWTDTLPFYHAKIVTDKSGNSYVYNALWNNSWIAKYDSGGNKKWMKQVPNVLITCLAISYDGSLIVTGFNNFGVATTVGGASVPNNYGLIGKSDGDLNWQWVNTQFQYGVSSVNVLPNGDIYTAGGSYGGQDSSCVRVFNSMGNYIKGAVKTKKDLEYIAADLQGNFYLAGFTAKNYPLVIDGNTIGPVCPNCEVGYLVKFNSLGKIEWYKIIERDVTVNSIRCDSANNIFIAGTSLSSLKVDSFILQNSFGICYVAKFNPKGELQWVQNSSLPAGQKGNSLLSDMILDSKGDAIIVGGVIGQQTFNQTTVSAHDVNYYYDLLIAKIYSEPTISPETFVSHTDGLVIYPNPNSGNFTIYYSNSQLNSVSVIVRNELGQTILLKEYPKTNAIAETFDLHSLAKGIYFVQVNTDQATEVKKIVVE